MAASGNAVVLSSSVKGGRAFILVQGANGGITVVANSIGANSDLGNPASNDFVTGATISNIWWSSPTAGSSAQILRGANVVFSGGTTGAWLRADGWPGIALFPAATINVHVADANSTVLIEVSKEYAGGSPGVSA